MRSAVLISLITALIGLGVTSKGWATPAGGGKRTAAEAVDPTIHATACEWVRHCGYHGCQAIKRCR